MRWTEREEHMAAISREESTSLRGDIAAAARAFAKLGYVHAFGHVSARDGDRILITPTAPPLAAQRREDALAVDFDGAILSGDAKNRPIEVFLHLEIYRARADIGAICRAHPPFAALWPDGDIPPIQHGFGGIVGALAAFDMCDLVHNPRLGQAAAAALGAADGLFLRGNGALTVGRDVGEAAARLWSLEERCAYALRQARPRAAFSHDELNLRQRWYPAEAGRIWLWLKYVAESADSSSSRI
jgi:ribulose-5-phosphate 4-epimerase/fuculose-1-phosphate aldolase